MNVVLQVWKSIGIIDLIGKLARSIRRRVKAGIKPSLLIVDTLPSPPSFA